MLNVFNRNTADKTESGALVGVPQHNRTSDHRKKLRWLISNPPEDLAKVMTITPEIASVMMERNKDEEWRNRPHSEKGVARYAKAMQRGGWKLTGEPIIFTKTGRLVNGQHRLMACIASGRSFQSLVVVGIDDDAFKFMDTGIARTAGHIFAIEGIPNSSLAAAAARLLYGYLNRDGWDGRTVTVDNEPLLTFYRAHEDIQDSLKFARELYAANLMPPSWAGFVHYICAAKHRREADAFFDAVATGIGLNSKTLPAYKLRARLIKNATDTTKLSEAHLAAYTIQAWNSHRRGEERALFRWRNEQSPNEAFPRAI